MRKFFINGQFRRILRRINQKSAETVRLRYICENVGRKAYILHGEKYKQLINKIYSLNNIVILCQWYVIIYTYVVRESKKSQYIVQKL